MKATGEVMAISRTFESALLKAVTCLEGGFMGLRLKSTDDLTDEELVLKICKCDDERVFAAAEALRRGMSIDSLHEIAGIDRWFLSGINNIVDMEKHLKENTLRPELLYAAEAMGFTNQEICELSGVDDNELEDMRKSNGIYTVYKIVATCGGEFKS